MRVTTEHGNFILDCELPAQRNQRVAGIMSGQLQPYRQPLPGATPEGHLTGVPCDVHIDNGDRLCVTCFPFGRNSSASGFIARVWQAEP